MPAIWYNDGTKWKLLAPSGFPDEASLHSLVEQEPQILPLAGSPQLAIVGREVRLGSGYADLIAIEPSGRLAVIEVKLARNAEARRAVISQALAYASYLFGSSLEDVERNILASHLAQRGYTSLADAIVHTAQDISFDESEFRSALSKSLAEGRFRLIFVLDSAPDELVSLASFLEAISDKLVIDLIGVGSFNVGGSQIIVPQRITPEARKTAAEQRQAEGSPAAKGIYTRGSAEFRKAIDEAPPEAHGALTRLCDWADSLEAKGLATLGTYWMNNGLSWSLLPYVPVDNVGLVTIYNWRGKPYLAFWRSVFERRAPNSIRPVEACISPTLLGQGNQIGGNDVSDELLAVLTTAYEEAAAGNIHTPTSNVRAAFPLAAGGEGDRGGEVQFR
jgi:hypothetical protein